MQQHTCRATGITCIDYRPNKQTVKYLEEKFETFDLIAVAGSTKGIAGNDEAIRSYLVRQFEISYSLHHSRNFILFNHSDCGAYNISDETEEKKIQLEDMEKAKKILEEKFADVEIEKIWIQLKDPLGKEVEFIKID